MRLHELLAILDMVIAVRVLDICFSRSDTKRVLRVRYR